jgi:hypothetical protein
VKDWTPSPFGDEGDDVALTRNELTRNAVVAPRRSYKSKPVKQRRCKSCRRVMRYDICICEYPMDEM